MAMIVMTHLNSHPNKGRSGGENGTDYQNKLPKFHDLFQPYPNRLCYIPLNYSLKTVVNKALAKDFSERF